MQTYEFLPEGDGRQMRISGSTFAGLISAAIQGISSTFGPSDDGAEEVIERPFSLTAGDAGAMLLEILEAVRKNSLTFHEVYDGVRFTLITPKKAEGAFLGKKISTRGGESIEKFVLPSGSVAKNEEGVWETVVELR